LDDKDRKIQELEQRIAKIEMMLNLNSNLQLSEFHGTPPQTLQSQQSSPSPQETSSAQTMQHTPQQNPQQQSQQSSPQQLPVEGEFPDWPKLRPRGNSLDWDGFGKVWVPRIFIVVLLIGVVFGFMAAVNAGLINRQTRVGIGYLCVILLLYVGERQIAKKRHALGRVLIGGSVSIGLLTTFAAASLYEFIGSATAYILGIVLVLTGLSFASRHKSQSLSILSTVAGFLLPFLFKSHAGSINFYIFYSAIISFGFALYSYFRNEVALRLVALGILQVSFFFFGLIHRPFNMFAYVLIVQNLAYASMLLLRRQDTAEKIAILPSVGLTFLWVFAVLPKVQIDWVLIALILFYAGFTVTAHRIKKSKTVYLAALVLLIAVYLIHAFSSQVYTPIILIEALGSVYIGIRENNRKLTTFNLVFYSLGSANVLLGSGNFLVFGSFPSLFSSLHLSFLVLVITLFAMYWLFEKSKTKSIQFMNALRWAFIAIFLVYLSDISLTLTDGAGFSTRMLVLSLIWILYAFGLIALGAKLDSKNSRMAGIIFLFICLCKVVLFDLPSVTMTVRAILFLALGSIGVYVSKLFYKK
jgi:uncharacterized membrane protein